MRTALCDLLGVEVPIVQAPMGSIATPALAAAVSNAGGLGTVGLTWHSPDGVGRAVEELRALTERPFAVNLLLDWPQEERLEAALAAGARVVSFAWGEPARYVRAARAAGATVLVTVGSAEQARRAVAAGAHAVVAQGWEAGGHVVSTVATSVLVPAVADAVGPVPVIAAGGIADGRGLVAALALGAAGAWLGTRFLLAQEALVHPDYRARLVAAAETDTTYSELFDLGWPDAPHRTLRNSTVERWELAGRPPSGERPGEGEVVATYPDGSAIVRYASASALPDVSGDVEALSLWAGQGVGLVRRVQPAAEIVRELAAEAAQVLARLP